MAKILQILGSLGRGGAEAMVMNYYRVAAENGIQFDFILHANAENGYEAEAKTLGARLFFLPRPGSIGFLKYVKNIKRIIIENGPYDAVHIHTDSQGFMGAIAAKQAGIKNILTHSHTSSYRKIKALTNRIVGDVCKVKRLACGQKAGEALYGKRHFEIIQNAIDIQKYMVVDDEVVAKKKKDLNLAGRYIIGQVGRLIDVKNHAFLLNSIAPILKENKDVVLCLAGDGELRSVLEQQCRDLKIESSVVFLGVVSNMEVLYSMFDLVVLPSKFEGLPLVTVEVQAAGKTLLCSDAVTSECDCGLDLVSFLPLDEGVWRDKLRKYIFQQVVAPSNALRVKKLKEYDVKEQLTKLRNMYGV